MQFPRIVKFTRSTLKAVKPIMNNIIKNFKKANKDLSKTILVEKSYR